MEIPASRLACKLKKMKVSYFGLIFRRDDGKLYCMREGHKKSGMSKQLLETLCTHSVSVCLFAHLLRVPEKKQIF